MGGDITVVQRTGQRIVLHADGRAPTLDAPVSKGTMKKRTMPLPALNVLLVEDIELNVIVARSVLEKLGNSVEVAMNGHDALEMFDPDEFDLVLLDIQLPDMTGLDIARKLRQRLRRCAICRRWWHSPPTC